MKILILLFTLTGFLHYTEQSGGFRAYGGNTGWNEDFQRGPGESSDGHQGATLVRLFEPHGGRLAVDTVPAGSRVIIYEPNGIVHYGDLEFTTNWQTGNILNLSTHNVVVLVENGQKLVSILNTAPERQNPIRRYFCVIQTPLQTFFETKLKIYENELIEKVPNLVFVRLPNTMGPLYYGILKPSDTTRPN